MPDPSDLSHVNFRGKFRNTGNSALRISCVSGSRTGKYRHSLWCTQNGHYYGSNKWSKTSFWVSTIVPETVCVHKPHSLDAKVAISNLSDVLTNPGILHYPLRNLSASRQLPLGHVLVVPCGNIHSIPENPELSPMASCRGCRSGVYSAAGTGWCGSGVPGVPGGCPMGGAQWVYHGWCTVGVQWVHTVVYIG